MILVSKKLGSSLQVDLLDIRHYRALDYYNRPLHTKGLIYGKRCIPFAPIKPFFLKPICAQKHSPYAPKIFLIKTC